MNEINFKNILSHLGEPVFVLNNEGAIIYVNDCFLQHSIFTKEEVLSSNSNQMFQNGQTDVNIFQMVKMQRQRITAFQVISNMADKKKQNCLVTQTPIMDTNGNVDYIVGIIRNIDELQRMIQCTNQSIDRTYRPDFVSSRIRSSGRPIYQSECMDSIFCIADSIADSDASILILGESGVGKEVLATYLHNNSNRKNNKLVTINCAALNESLLEAELFGYEKGSFTGAVSNGKRGLIEMADNGTLFLDEIDSLPLSIQAKLLRVLDNHEIRPVGGRENIKVNFRLIAATNANLEQLVIDHKFRTDLYYRVNILPITVPALRDRKDDIQILTDYFLEMFGKKYGRKKSLSFQAMEKLQNYYWPGNVRELRNFIERMVLITDTSCVEIKDIPEIFFLHQNKQTLKENIERSIKKNEYTEEDSLKVQIQNLEKQMIEKAVKSNGSLSKAAKSLGMSKSTLIRKRNQ